MLSIEKQMLFLLSRTDGMESQELIRIYENRDYSAPYIRNGLSRLKKEGYVITPSRSTYQITELGRSFIQTINQKPLLYNAKWDGMWHVVMVEIPETERKKRDQFRTDIIQAGFGLLHNSVYISPWSYKEETAQLIQKHGIENHVTLFRGTMEYRDITPERAQVIWQLDEIEAMYAEKWRWYEEQFEPEMNRILHSKAEPLELFLLYLHLGEVTSELYLSDPMLPEALLPKHWRGRTVLLHFQQCLDRLVQAIPGSSIYAQFTRPTNSGSGATEIPFIS